MYAGEERKDPSLGCESVGRRRSSFLCHVMGSGLCHIRPEPYTFFKIVEVFRTKMPDSATFH
jgi:hypothetical protein